MLGLWTSGGAFQESARKAQIHGIGLKTRQRWRGKISEPYEGAIEMPQIETQRGEGTIHPVQRPTPWNLQLESQQEEGERRGEEIGRGREGEAVTVKNFPKTMNDSKPQLVREAQLETGTLQPDSLQSQGRNKPKGM